MRSSFPHRWDLGHSSLSFSQSKLHWNHPLILLKCRFYSIYLGGGWKSIFLSRSFKWCCWSIGHLLISRTHSNLGPVFRRENGKERSRKIRCVRRGNQRNRKESKRSWGESERETKKKNKNRKCDSMALPTSLPPKCPHQGGHEVLIWPHLPTQGFRCLVQASQRAVLIRPAFSLAISHEIWDDPQPEPQKSACFLRFLSQYRKNEYQKPVHRRYKAGLIPSYNHARDPAKSSPSQCRWTRKYLDCFELIL